MSILLPLAEGVEELEAITISDILRRGGLTVVLAGVSDTLVPIGASRGARLLPDLTLNDALALGTKHYQAIVLPGGQPGTDNLLKNNTLIAFLQDFWQAIALSEDRYLAALCAAPKVLLAAGILQQQRLSVFPGALATLPEALANQELVITEAPVSVDGRLITGRGPGSALAFALTLLEKLAGRERRENVEAKLL